MTKYIQNDTTAQSTDSPAAYEQKLAALSTKTPVDAAKSVAVTLSRLEQLIKRCAPDYKALGVSLVLDGGAAYTVYLNAGHGAMPPTWLILYQSLVAQGKGGDIYKEYTTWKTGDGKLHRHGQKVGRGWQLDPHPTIAGASAEFHAAGWFFEGVENRKYIAAMVEALSPYVKLGLLNVVVMSHEWQDIPRGQRINLANAIFAAQKRENPKARAFWLGWHFNAAKSNANGICIFTSVGQTHSDKVAEVTLNNLGSLGFRPYNSDESEKGVPQVATIRTQRIDGDKDHEKNFDEVADTKMPAMLGEFGFFDNRIDASRIFYDPEYKRICIKAVTDALVADAKGEIK